MNTIAFEQFEVMNTESLTTFNGGGYKDPLRCLEAMEGGGLAASSAAALAIGSGPIGWAGGALIFGAGVGAGMLANGSADSCTIE
ncbi:hypothetical protein ACFSN5_08930 [Streptococcus tangpeifui]|uniref:hypothetical protein n=1 Tax=Streptococcus tangpeifui TaxID=2709400 RepID=UPI0013EBD442|nr:hypothetical protein [Streptococcus sp. ZJ373]